MNNIHLWLQAYSVLLVRMGARYMGNQTGKEFSYGPFLWLQAFHEESPWDDSQSQITWTDICTYPLKRNGQYVSSVQVLWAIPGATAPVRPGHFFRRVSALCASLGAGVLFHSQNFLDLLVPYIGGVDVDWGGNSWSFCLNRACLSSLRLPYKLWGPLGKPHPRQMGTQASLLCRQAASGSSTRPQPRKAPLSRKFPKSLTPDSESS